MSANRGSEFSNNSYNISIDYEALAEYRKDRRHVFLSFAIPALAIAAAVGLGVILFLYAYKPEIDKEWSHPFTGPLFMSMLIVSVIATVLLIFNKKIFRNYSETSIIVVNSILLAVIIVASPAVLSQLAAVIQLLNKEKVINYQDFWMVYLVPCFQFIICTIVYALLTIKKDNEFGFKLRLAAGIAFLVGFIVTFVWFMVFLSQNKWNFNTKTSFMRLMTVIATITTFIVNFILAKKCMYKTTSSQVAGDIIWASALPIAAVTSVFAIVIIIIGLIILLTAKTAGDAAVQSAENDRKYYGDAKITGTGEELHNNGDGTYTSRNGTRYRDTGFGSVTKID